MPQYLSFRDVNNCRVEVGSTESVNLEDLLRPDDNFGRLKKGDVVEIYSDQNLNAFWNGNKPTAELGMPISAHNLTTLTGANPRGINLICSEEGETATVTVLVAYSSLGLDS